MEGYGVFQRRGRAVMFTDVIDFILFMDCGESNKNKAETTC